MSHATCPKCLSPVHVALPDREAGMQSLYGITLWVPSGEKYVWIACQRCGSRFVVAGLPFRPGPLGNTMVLAVAEAYVEAKGLPPLVQAERVKLTKKAGCEIAEAYENAKSDPTDPDVQASYKALVEEVRAQHEALKKAGFKILPWDGPGQPYANSEELRRDVRDYRQLYVFKTAAGTVPHALLPAEDNDRFRAVHDFFGHAMSGNQFGPQGETNAFRDHYLMFSPAAGRALATETLGQNAWFNFSKHNEGRPAGQREYAEQKATLLNPALYEHLVKTKCEVLTPLVRPSLRVLPSVRRKTA